MLFYAILLFKCRNSGVRFDQAISVLYSRSSERMLFVQNGWMFNDKGCRDESSNVMHFRL